MYIAADTAIERFLDNSGPQPCPAEGTVWVDICGDPEPGWVPGSHRVAFDDIVASRGDTAGLLPEIASFNRALAGTGIQSDSTVVIYDDQHGLCASRLAWTLSVCGLEAVHIVDGGRSALIDAGLALTHEATPASDATTELTYKGLACCDAEAIQAHLDDPDWQIVDARSLEEYLGTDVRSRAGGHIPGAIHFDWRNVIRDEQTGLLLEPEDLGRRLAAAGIDPEKTICVYCQTHRRSSVLFGVMKWLGFRDVRGYPGAWSDWGNRSELPVETTAPASADSGE